MTLSNILTVISSLFPDNVIKSITPVKLRYVLNIMAKSAKVYAKNEIQVFKNPINTNNEFLENGDVAVGFLGDGTFIPFGKWTGESIQNINTTEDTNEIESLNNLDNWDTSPMWVPE